MAHPYKNLSGIDLRQPLQVGHSRCRIEIVQKQLI